MTHHEVTIEVMGVEMQVEYDHSPFLKGKWTLSNGDPGYPDEPEEIEITSIEINGYDWTNLVSEKALDLIIEQLSENN